MSRFKTSKYKNAYSYVYKREFWVNDLNVGSNLKSNSNHIKSSCDFIAFNHDSTSVGSIAVLPIDSCGRFTSFPQVAGHSGFVTDFDFSPFHGSLLATGSEDCIVKLWQIPEGGVSGALSSPAATFGPFEARVESLLFHPAADNVIGVSAGNTVKIWDVEHQAEKYVLGGHEDTVQSFSWHGDGSLLATICKDNKEKKLRVFDPRTSSCTGEAKGHSGQKDSRVLWLGDSNYVLTAGYSVTRDAELMLWDVQNLGKPVTRQSIGSTTGSPMLFFDNDSKMLFVAMKSESAILFYELTEKSPYLAQGGHVYRGSTQHKGMCMVPKRAVDVMSCQIVRLLQLTQSAIVPIGYHVQRKSYSDFHDDLFPNTAGGQPAMTAQQWFQGANDKVAKVSLSPASRKKTDTTPVKQESKPDKPTGKPSPPATSPVPSRESPSELVAGGQTEAFLRSPSPKVLNIVRSSKYRHIEGHMMHRSTLIDKIPKLSTIVPGDSDAFQVNKDRVAAVLAVSGGQIGVFELSKPGRLDTDEVPTLQNTANVMDFVFDPFNNRRLVVACDDARIRVWNIPEGGLTHTLTEPEFFLIGHQEKPNLLAFHPQASSLLASVGYDGRLLIWNLDTQKVEITMDPLPEPLFALAWSQDGRQLATLGKDHRLRVYEPRTSTSPVKEGEGPEGSRGARLIWVNSKRFIVSGFSKTSVRTLTVYSVDDLSKPQAVVGTNVSPATLLPYYDPDTHLLFLSGKGDTSVLAYEYVEDQEPYLFEVNPFAIGSPHQAVAFLPKTLCDVKRVEIARAVRLCKSSVEPFYFTVPRTKTEYFQDDIFCDTLAWWEPALTAAEWLQGKDAFQQCISLCPKEMKPLSEAPKAAPAAKRFPSYNPQYKTDEEKKEELMSAMIQKMGDKEEAPLPQENMDGCESDEWSD